MFIRPPKSINLPPLIFQQGLCLFQCCLQDPQHMQHFAQLSSQYHSIEHRIEAYLEPNQVSAMEFFLLKQLTDFRRQLFLQESSIIDLWLGSKYDYNNILKNRFDNVSTTSNSQKYFLSCVVPNLLLLYSASPVVRLVHFDKKIYCSSPIFSSNSEVSET